MNQTMMTTAPSRPLHRSVRWVLLGVFMAVAATVTISAWAQPMRHGPGGGGMMFGGSPEHVARGVDHMLAGVDVTDAQRTQVKQIAQAAAVDLKVTRDATRALHEKSVQIFAAPTVDAAAAESVRQQLQVKHDDASRRTLQAMLDVSRVLTPEQRAKLAERAKQRGAEMHERQERQERGKFMERQPPK